MVEAINKNKNKIFKGLGFENDFEDNYEENLYEESNFHNVFKVRPQTEAEALKLERQLNEKYKRTHISYEEIEKEMEDIRKKDLNSEK